MTYSLEEILSATNNFANKNLITESALGKVYKGQLSRDGNLINVTLRRLICAYGLGDELQIEVSMLKSLQHKNIISVLGHYDDNNEKIIIYDEAFHGTLDQHISDPTLTWSQRLGICLGVARALSYIYYDIIHCDINSSKIILDEDWEPKIYGFELSTEYPQCWRHRLLFSRYFHTNTMTPKYDVYCFGMLLVEVLCGRKLVKSDVAREELDNVIDPNFRKQMDTESLRRFKELAYKCLNHQLIEHPTMDQIVIELEDALELQREHENIEHPVVANEGTSSSSLKIDFMKIPLSVIRQATNNFHRKCFIGSGGYADVYRAELDVLDIQSLSSVEGKSKKELPKIKKEVAIKKIKHGSGMQGFFTEIELLSSCNHPNIVSLVGFSRENDVPVLVYEYASNGSLGDYLRSDVKTFNLTWAQRLQICLDTANGINYLHTNKEGKQRIIHRDIKSDNILLDENLNAKVADFGLSKFHMQKASTVHTKHIAGTLFYLNPEYSTTNKYKKESDVYSFGVVLFEVLTGKLAYNSIYIDENEKGLAPIARRRFNEGTLKELIDPTIIEEDDDHTFTLNRGLNQDSFDTFSKIAYQCLMETQAKRPTMEVVVKEVQNALNLQGEAMVLFRYPLPDILSATVNFAETYRLDTIGIVYKAELDHSGNHSLLVTEGKYNGEPSKKRNTVAIKHITSEEEGQGIQEFIEELEMRTSYKHPNLVSLLGFCNKGDKMILVYEHVSDISLEDYLKRGDTFTWTHRLCMCLEIARGLDHLHTMIVNPRRIIHIDIKSANILVYNTWGAKLAYFVIPVLQPANQEVGMKVYEDLEHEKTLKLGREHDIYSFGVLLFEIFCGRVAYDAVYIKENDGGLAAIARQCLNDGTIERIIDPSLKSENIFTSNKDSIDTFLDVAYQCLGGGAERPTMKLVINELEKALNFYHHIQ